MTKAELLNNAKGSKPQHRNYWIKRASSKQTSAILSKRQNAMKANLSARSAPQRRNAEKKKRLNV